MRKKTPESESDWAEDYSDDDDFVSVKKKKSKKSSDPIDDTLMEYSKRFGGGSLETTDDEKTMSIPALVGDVSSTTATTTTSFKFTKDTLFSSESRKLHSSNQHRKKSSKAPKILAKVSDPKIKKRKSTDKAAANVLARQMNPVEVKYRMREVKMFSIQHPTKQSAELNLATTDTRVQSNKTSPVTVDLFSSKYRGPGGKDGFQCMICYVDKMISDENKKMPGTFATVNNYRAHFYEQHGTEKDSPFVCTFPGCSHRRTNTSRLNTHLATHSNEKTVKCREEGCEKYFARPYIMETHWRQSHGPEAARSHRCCDCSEAFTTPYLLSVHRKSTHIPPSYQCKICCKLYTLYGNLVGHVQRFHLRKDRVDCAECGRSVLRTHIKRHTLMHEKNKDLYYTLCEETAEDVLTFEGHLKSEGHRKLFRTIFESGAMKKYPHAVPLTEEDKKKKSFYPIIEYDQMDKYNNPYFNACPEGTCPACDLTSVASTVNYLDIKWVIPIPDTPFTCTSTYCLYLTLLTRTVNGQFLQSRYRGQVQHRDGFGDRVSGHERGRDGKETAAIFMQREEDCVKECNKPCMDNRFHKKTWDREYILMFGCDPRHKNPNQVNFGERNLIKQFQCQDRPTGGINIQDGGTLKFVEQITKSK